MSDCSNFSAYLFYFFDNILSAYSLSFFISLVLFGERYLVGYYLLNTIFFHGLLVSYVKRLNIPSGVVGACRLDLAYEHFKVLLTYFIGFDG